MIIIIYFTGKGAGSLIGGYLMKFFGTRPTYQIFACATFITGCIYYLFNTFYLRKRATSYDSDFCKKKQTPTDIECNETNKDGDKTIAPIDVTKSEAKLENAVVDKVKEPDANRAKLVSDNADGGSDSGVDNPAYNETDASETRKDESKVNG